MISLQIWTQSLAWLSNLSEDTWVVNSRIGIPTQISRESSEAFFLPSGAGHSQVPQALSDFLSQATFKRLQMTCPKCGLEFLLVSGKERPQITRLRSGCRVDLQGSQSEAGGWAGSGTCCGLYQTHHQEFPIGCGFYPKINPGRVGKVRRKFRFWKPKSMRKTWRNLKLP